MSKEPEFPKTLRECIRYFADDERAFSFMRTIRWPDGIVRCPTCNHTDVSFVSTRKVWKCKTLHGKETVLDQGRNGDGRFAYQP